MEINITFNTLDVGEELFIQIEGGTHYEALLASVSLQGGRTLRRGYVGRVKDVVGFVYARRYYVV